MNVRTRVSFDVSEPVRRALNIYASRMGMTVGDVIEVFVHTHLAEDLELAERSIAAGEAGPPKKGRKPRD